MSGVNKNYEAAVRAQHMAADPSGTRLASANAGSGKTRVLVDRVSRILLQKTPPEKILCLTYTKAAASEMQSRLFKTLGEWSVMEEGQLIAKLRNLLGGEAENIDLGDARRLFAQALETPEGLKVQTIHAFCERILSRFPIEAGILPGYEPIEDSEMRTIREAVRDDILRDAAAKPLGQLNQAIQHLTAEKADQTLDDLFRWMSGSPEKISHWIETGGVKPLADEFGLPEDADAGTIMAEAWNAGNIDHIRRMAADLLASSSKTDPNTGQAILAACDVIDPVAACQAYASAFLTKAGSPRKSIVTKQASAAAQDFFAVDGPEVSRILHAVEQTKAASCLAMSRAVLTVAKAYAQTFAQTKRRRRGLDFNDQIILVRDLLHRSEVSDWIRYKLDGGIEHILVDEAQDTAPLQWDIIDALAEPFLQDNPDRKTRHARTLFAVGDEKQSIYSFQGAEPEQFLRKIQYYAGTHGIADIRMRMSFRSAPDILEAVDAVFVDNGAVQRMFDETDFPPASDVIRHTANRTDRGQVDLWPAVPKPETEAEKEPWDTTPVDARGKSDAREQLADQIASTIDNWLKEGEPIFDRDLGETRPMRAGDILILVRQRNDFFDAVIRNLKGYGVPVAGADRLILKNSIAVKDMLSLARFVLLPSDDLSLAEVLKSPLFGFDDDDLFAVAAKRKNLSLWQSVKDKRPDISETLHNIINYSHRFAPYEFFARVLDIVDDDGQSFTKRIYKRLGLEAKDALDAFLARALAHQRQGAPSLQHFVQIFTQDDQELKREMDSGAGQVRVMTVHGAKGLEAPIVILPDTTQTPRTRAAIIPVKNGFAIPANAKQTPAALEPYKEALKAKDLQENLRLLYVAMTRAESRLVVCGYKHGHGLGTISQESWYAEIEAAFANLNTRAIQTPFGEGLSFGNGAKAATTEAANDSVQIHELKDWMFRPAPKLPPIRQSETASHLLASDTDSLVPVRSPLASTSAPKRFLRGNIIHKLLETLPEFPRERRPEIAQTILESYRELDEDMRNTINREVFAVLDNPDFAEMFAAGSRAEVSLAGTAKTFPEGLFINAQIDRLSITERSVFIVDYKSNRPPPTNPANVPDIYWGQMAAYRELLREIYPDKTVTCALLWTDGPHLMVLDDKGLDAALTKIRALPT